MTDISVEIVSPSSGELGSFGSFSESFDQRARDITDCISHVTQILRDRLTSELQSSHDHMWTTREIEVGFDFSLEAETGVLIARAGAKGTFSVRLRLQQKDKATNVEQPE